MSKKICIQLLIITAVIAGSIFIMEELFPSKQKIKMGNSKVEISSIEFMTPMPFLELNWEGNKFSEWEKSVQTRIKKVFSSTETCRDVTLQMTIYRDQEPLIEVSASPRILPKKMDGIIELLKTPPAPVHRHNISDL